MREIPEEEVRAAQEKMLGVHDALVTHLVGTLNQHLTAAHLRAALEEGAPESTKAILEAIKNPAELVALNEYLVYVAHGTVETFFPLLVQKVVQMSDHLIENQVNNHLQAYGHVPSKRVIGKGEGTISVGIDKQTESLAAINISDEMGGVELIVDRAELSILLDGMEQVKEEMRHGQ